ncbi:MAG: hypothetical protein IPJ74_01355 [Saprospiraceae bacterium]|nr:hypothetical protein [Saprospiraceae bacterium]
MKNVLFCIGLLCLSANTFAQKIMTAKAQKLYELAETDFKKFAEEIAGNSKSDFTRTQNIVTWFAEHFDWKSTDYKKERLRKLSSDAVATATNWRLSPLNV